MAKISLTVKPKLELVVKEQGTLLPGVTSVNGERGDVIIDSETVGLENVDNTSDLGKPISTSTQSALDNKVDKVTGKGLSTEDYTTVEKNKLASITEIFTTALKNAYDSTVTWISTNGTNVLNHISSTSNPHNVTASQTGALTAVPSASIGQTELKAELKDTVNMAANNIDWSVGIHFICATSGAVTLTDSSRVTNKGVILELTNAASVNFPSGWVLKSGADDFAATSTIYAVCLSGSVVEYSIRNDA
jgi:hypothetical protein